VWGVAFYIAVLVVARAGLSPALADSRRPSQLLVAMTGFGVLFSLWLTYLELFVIHAICQWCVISAILTTVLFVVSVLDLREVSVVDDELLDEAAAALKGLGYGRGIRNTQEVSIRAVKQDEN
jgi:Predicted membrane protein